MTTTLHRRGALGPLLSGLWLCAALGAAAAAEPSPGDPVETEAVALLSQYLMLDTTNPPGNELIAARFLQALFDHEGIETRVIESVPGRGNVHARVPGRGTRPAIVLLNHLDVVPADRSLWTEEPFGGVVKDGRIWGRGALDMKGVAIAQAMVMLLVKRQGVALDADVIFLGTADEETGGAHGAGFLTSTHWDLVKHAGVVLNEGGGIGVRNGRPFYGIAFAEKVPLRLTLKATGSAGHGATPRPGSAVNRLIAALSRVVAYEPPIKVLPEVQQFYSTVAQDLPWPLSAYLRDLSTTLQDPEAVARFTREPVENARVRNTISVTVLHASSSINVIPGEARAQLDVRLLPGEDPHAFVDRLKRVIDDEAIIVEYATPILGGASPTTHRLFDIVGAVAREEDPRARAVPMLQPERTDCAYFRRRAIPCYGFPWFTLAGNDLTSIHGNDEYLSIANLMNAVRRLYAVVRRLGAE